MQLPIPSYQVAGLTRRQTTISCGRNGWIGMFANGNSPRELQHTPGAYPNHTQSRIPSETSGLRVRGMFWGYVGEFLETNIITVTGGIYLPSKLTIAPE